MQQILPVAYTISHQDSLIQWGQDHLVARVPGHSDFWNVTHYGFTYFSGLTLLKEAPGNFVLETNLVADYREQFDQTGIILMLDQNHWIKTGIEFVDGKKWLSVVVTHDVSDWSVRPVDQAAERIRVRLHREGDFCEISFSVDGNPFEMARLAPFAPSSGLKAGFMGAAPKGNGFIATFENILWKTL
ncbi:DUF1349 domain-containing protein [Flavihumibacter rivuli]|uniref:DUF1349 domain-containing protein n=1 Tax=Flavihumibacter rivuli TaxID=2838156 RepID=UPI001BDE1ED9|nr:DUF1349 domain-containing protein [Flavihumibacter rivuli]ULQ56288.1 DUF1349 domain-containing protein [Flavihumibacter rivuli]